MSLEALVLVLALTIAVSATWWVRVNVDEAWFLEVVRRVHGGARLYQDVFFGAGPVPVWVAAGAVRLSRPQITVLRALTIGYGFLIWVSGYALLDGIGVAPGLAALFVIGSLALGGHHLVPDSHYAQLSVLGAMVAGAGVAHGSWMISGIGLFLAISAKYTQGLISAAWALPLLAISAGPGAALWAALLVAAGTLVVGAVLGRAGVRSFLSVAVARKGRYLSTAAVRPGRDLIRLLKRSGPTTGYRLITGVGPIAVFTTAGAGLVAMVAALAAGLVQGETSLVLGAALIATGLAAAVPRADYDHLVSAMPLVVAGLLVVAAWLGPSTAAEAAVGVLMMVVLMGTLASVAVTARHEVTRRDLPHLRLLPVRRQSGVWPDETETLRSVAGDDVFVLRRDAPFFYLAGQIRNPTPYDYPLAPTFGPSGQAQVISDIASGAVRWICYPGPAGGPLAPTELEHFMAGLSSIARTTVGGLYDASQHSPSE